MKSLRKSIICLPVAMPNQVRKFYSLLNLSKTSKSESRDSANLSTIIRQLTKRLSESKKSLRMS